MPLSDHFQNRHWNRAEFPVMHVLVCEDDIANQAIIADKLARLFGAQGKVHASFVSGGLAAAAIIESQRVDLILLDHDMPYGNGSDLLAWLRTRSSSVPVITFSGLDPNNVHMMSMGAHHLFRKDQVFQGLADSVILDSLFPKS